MTAKSTSDSTPSQRKPARKAAAPGKAIPNPDGPPLSDVDRESMRRVAPVKDLRWKLNMSQEEFAAAYGIPLEMLRAWERRELEPSTAEDAYIRLIARDPERARMVAS